LVSGTALEVNTLQAYAARTIMRKSGLATSSVSPAEFDMQTYQESLLDTFDEETQEDTDSEKLADNDNDDGQDKEKDENNDKDKEDSDDNKGMNKEGVEEEEQEGITANNGNPNTDETVDTSVATSSENN